VSTRGIEESRAVSKSPHKKFGYFLAISQQAVSADTTTISAAGFLLKNKDNIS
jgi:hypothetical protein